MPGLETLTLVLLAGAVRVILVGLTTTRMMTKAGQVVGEAVVVPVVAALETTIVEVQVVTALRAINASSAVKKVIFQETVLTYNREDLEEMQEEATEDASSANKRVIWPEIALTSQLMTPREEVAAEAAKVVQEVQ
jgi:hypothetical protein